MNNFFKIFILIFFVAFKASCGIQWVPKKTIIKTASTATYDCPVVIDKTSAGSGKAIVILYDTNQRIQPAYSSDFGKTWTKCTPITTAQTSNAKLVATSTGQHAIATWNNADDTTIEASFSSNYGLTWSTPSTIYATAASPEIAMNDAGQAIIVFDGTSNAAIAVHSTSYGSTWSSSVSIANMGTGVRIAMDANSKAAIVAKISNTSINTSYTADAGQTWSAASVLQNENVTNQDIKMSNSGTASIFWFILESNGEVTKTEYSSSTNSGQTWSSVRTLFTPQVFSYKYFNLTFSESNNIVFAVQYLNMDEINIPRPYFTSINAENFIVNDLPRFNQNNVIYQAISVQSRSFFVSAFSGSDIIHSSNLDEDEDADASISNFNNDGAARVGLAMDYFGNTIMTRHVPGKTTIDIVLGSPLKINGNTASDAYIIPKNLKNNIDWSPVHGAVSYNFYRNSSLVKAFSPGESLNFTDNKRKKGDQVTYQVTWVDTNGLESPKNAPLSTEVID